MEVPARLGVSERASWHREAGQKAAQRQREQPAEIGVGNRRPAMGREDGVGCIDRTRSIGNYRPVPVQHDFDPGRADGGPFWLGITRRARQPGAAVAHSSMVTGDGSSIRHRWNIHR